MKRIWFTILAAVFLLSGCGITEASGADNKEDDITASASDKEQEKPYSLELIFGNGEVLQKEMTLLAVPGYRNIGGYHPQTYVEYKYIALQDYETDKTEYLDSLFGLEPESNPKATSLAVSSAIFEDGTIYTFGDAYKAEVDRESRTLKVWLWRDEPYEQERQYFNSSTAATIE